MFDPIHFLRLREDPSADRALRLCAWYLVATRFAPSSRRTSESRTGSFHDIDMENMIQTLRASSF